MSETHEFQAEIKQLLDIVIHSLYTEKEIFVRELVSNASDALEKLRHTQITEKEVVDDQLKLEINLTTDDKAKTLTIQDHGIGMTRDELVKFLGTIAHSGSKAFLKAIKEGGAKNDNLIGQFGVGFYSAFMVAKSVKVYSRSWQKEEKAHVWTSDGSGSYTVDEVEGESRGTKIVIELKDDCEDYAKEDKIKTILERYSAFVSFPINLNGKHINTVSALWLRSKNEIKDEEYTEFYKFQSHAYDEPRLKLHFSADAPLAINSILFVPQSNPEKFGMTRRFALLPQSPHRPGAKGSAPRMGPLPQGGRRLRGSAAQHFPRDDAGPRPHRKTGQGDHQALPQIPRRRSQEPSRRFR